MGVSGDPEPGDQPDFTAKRTEGIVRWSAALLLTFHYGREVSAYPTFTSFDWRALYNIENKGRITIEFGHLR